VAPHVIAGEHRWKGAGDQWIGVVHELEVQMRGGGVAGAADSTDHITTPDVLAYVDSD
jgi:hypothetical protein